MKLSVVISTYKRANQLKAAIDSLQQGTRSPDEIIVVASKGDGETQAALKGIKGIRYCVIEADRVLPKENRGIEDARGEVICFIDDDVTVPTCWLSRVEGIFETRREVGAVGGPCVPVIDGREQRELTQRAPFITFYGKVGGGSYKIPPKAGYADHLRGCNMCFRKELLTSFEERLKGDGSRFETDACLGLRAKGYKIWYDPGAHVLHHLAPREGIQREIDPRAMYWFNFNNTYVLLKHFGPLRRLVFIIYTFLVGDYMSRGLLYVLGRAVRRCDPAVVLEILPIYAGKLRAIRDLLSNP